MNNFKYPMISVTLTNDRNNSRSQTFLVVYREYTSLRQIIIFMGQKKKESNQIYS